MATRKKKTRRKAPARRTPRSSEKIANPQGTEGTYEVGYKKPPVEHQFKPGQSGNPAGPPKARSNLWRHLCTVMAMSPKEVAKFARRKDLTLAQLIAVKNVQQIRKGICRKDVAAIVKIMIEHDEGKPAVDVHMTTEPPLTPEECDEIRRAMKGT